MTSLHFLGILYNRGSDQAARNQKPKDNKMNDATANLWHTADKLKVGAMYTEATRNPDAEIRKAFKADKEIVGTRAWAICECMKLPNPATSYTEEEVSAIMAALNA